jgi:hypothetical protein
MDKEKDLQEVLVATDFHHRLRCAIEGLIYDPPAECAKVATLAEVLRRGGPIQDVRLPEDVPARIAASMRGETYVALPSLPDDGFHARLVRAVQR